MSEPTPLQDQSTLPGYQSDATGDEVMASLALADSAIQIADLAVPTGEGARDGLLTAADKAKLDGIEDEATADQTAQEIATAIDADETAEATLKTALELGSAAYTASTEYANSSQGALAATAVQPTALIPIDLLTALAFGAR